MKQFPKRSNAALSTRGRRRLNHCEKRSTKITTNFNPRELSVVDSLAALSELSRSEYIRTAAVQGNVLGRAKALERDVVRALGEASSAVNTLSAKAYGRGGAIGRDECAELVGALLQLCEQMQVVRSTLHFNDRAQGK
tara:strand:+ start:2514 stop:2927 length:414 start_codon:yes stop_codon:yes gene_type:complete